MFSDFKKNKLRGLVPLKPHIENQILNEIAEAICVLDAHDFRIIWANHTFLEQTGYTENSIPGITCYKATHHRTTPCEGPGEECPLHEALEKRNKSACDHIHFDSEGNEMVVEISVHPVVEPGGEIRRVIHISRDVTYKRELERRLLKKTEELVEINVGLKQRVEKEIRERLKHEELLMYQSRLAVLGEMFRAMAHQWRQPLGSLSIILDDVVDADQAGELNSEYLSRSISDAHLQVSLMSGVLEDFRRFIDPGVRREAFDLVDSLKEFLRLFVRMYISAGIRIIIMIGSDNRTKTFEDVSVFMNECDDKISVVGFKNEFKHVLLNIANNARDALENAETKNPEIRFIIAQSGNNIKFQIVDNGPGIPGEILDKIFDPNYSTKSGGFGIGLYLSRMMIEDHMQGKIYAESGDENGAAIVIQWDEVVKG